MTYLGISQDKCVCTDLSQPFTGLLFSVRKANSWHESGLVRLTLCILFHTKYQKDIQHNPGIGFRSGYPEITFIKSGYNEISQYNSIWGFNVEQNLRYPISMDIMVHAGFRDAWLDIPDPPQAQLALTSTMKKHVCGRGFGVWFSPSTGRRSGQYVTPSELCLYWHAQDHSLLTRNILVYPSLFGDTLGLSTRRFLSFCCLRIAPYDSMNIIFLVYADDAVNQICTPVVKSHSPGEGELSQACSLSGSLRLCKFQCKGQGCSNAKGQGWNMLEFE